MPSKLPEIPDSWFKLIQLLMGSLVTILVLLGYQKVDKVETGQIVTHQKQDANAAKLEATETKVDKAAAVAVEVKKDLAMQNATVAKTADKTEEVLKTVKSKDK